MCAGATLASSKTFRHFSSDSKYFLNPSSGRLEEVDLERGVLMMSGRRILLSGQTFFSFMRLRKLRPGQQVFRDGEAEWC
jgi:hypothetical protein